MLNILVKEFLTMHRFTRYCILLIKYYEAYVAHRQARRKTFLTDWLVTSTISSTAGQIPNQLYMRKNDS